MLQRKLKKYKVVFNMEYNPYRQKYNNLRKQIKQKNEQKKILINELKCFDNTNIGTLFFSLEEVKKSTKNYTILIKNLEKEINLVNKDILENKKYIQTSLNPLNWFNEKQKYYKEKSKQLKISSTKINKYKNKTLLLLLEADNSKNEINTNIDKYKSFNKTNISYQVETLTKEINLLEQEFGKISNLKHRVDEKLKSIIEQISKYESSIATKHEKIIEANYFENDLDDAPSSYERAKIHECCENVFGEGNPKKIIRENEKSLRQLGRDLEKLKIRAFEVGKKASREIKKLVIDGNNMCYEGDDFVGLLPILTSTKELQQDYEIIIVFDASIRSILNTNDQIIREKFHNEIKVHIVPSTLKADETIIDIASDDSTCYMLSNDRFGDYRDKEAIENNRLIRHEIVDNKIIIHDLNINKKYN